jgi:hypothetical protein|tara:strand:+ start:570 stop:710 length:141 start_codon:yes stop_codon:yes gene_type:complete
MNPSMEEQLGAWTRLIEIAHGISEGEEWALDACERLAEQYPLEDHE